MSSAEEEQKKITPEALQLRRKLLQEHYKHALVTPTRRTTSYQSSCGDSSDEYDSDDEQQQQYLEGQHKKKRDLEYHPKEQQDTRKWKKWKNSLAVKNDLKTAATMIEDESSLEDESSTIEVVEKNSDSIKPTKDSKEENQKIKNVQQKKTRKQKQAVEEKILTQSEFKKLSFEERLNELAKYKEVHGHCNVSKHLTKQTSLAWWVYRLRQTRQGGKSGYKKFKLTPANIAKLDELGFQWKFVKTFEEHLLDLKKYKARHGNCNVPYKYKDNPTLGPWCRAMKASYQSFKQGKEPQQQLNQEMIDKLESIGFSWKASRYRTFQERLSDLKEYKRIHGHCNVKWKYKENPSLAEWCVRIRTGYSYFVAGQKSPSYNLTPSMVEQLEQVGFIFKKFRSADEHILDLQTFKDEHGHCNVPRRYKDNQRLGVWVVNMRVAYRSIQAGQKPKYRLTQSMINQLNDMGFSWQGKR